MGPAPQQGDGHISWVQLASQAVRILDCDFCAHHADDGMPQPFWVGEAYQPGGLVLVARNPASNKDLPATAKRLLQELRRDRNQAAFLVWSRWRIAHMTSTPWTQWQRAFRPAVAGFAAPEQLAWLNVVPFCTNDNASPSKAMLAHGRTEHLAPTLALLRPRAVITRYQAARLAVAQIPGPWQQGEPLCLDGRVATNTAITHVRTTLAARGHGPSSQPDRAHIAQVRPEPRPPLRLGTSASREDALEDLRSGLLAALTTTSGYPPVERASYTSVADRPVWAFVQRRAGSIVVKFRVAPPYRVADTIAAHLADAGVSAQVRDVRSGSGSTRLWVYLEGPTDLAGLRAELPQLWLDYQRLK